MYPSTPLTPLTFLERSAKAYPNRTALVVNDEVTNYTDLLFRTRCFSQALTRHGVQYGDRVAVLAANNKQLLELHFAIPGVGAMIVMLNPWLSAHDTIALINFCEPSVLIADMDVFEKKFATWPNGLEVVPKLILIGRGDTAGISPQVEYLDYEKCLQHEDGSVPLDHNIRSELDPIAINFTSGTTGKPKGVVYNHRAAYLHALGQVLMLEINRRSNYLWTLPMFHVNGWGHMWMGVAAGCTQVIPAINATEELESICVALVKKHMITHLAGAPRLVRRLADTVKQDDAFRGLTIVTGGASPSTALVKNLESMGVNLIHQYGLNETCGPYVVCEEQDEWQCLSSEERAVLRARQGTATVHAGTGLRVVDENSKDVPRDGKTLGEVIMAGNTLTSGYFRNPQASEKAFRHGWFYSGDMAVVHPDGNLEIRDRIKDLIYVETDYGWENISSIEVENVLCRNTAIQDAAVVAIQLEATLKNRPLLVAFVELSETGQLTEKEFYDFCEECLSVYKRPEVVIFSELPKTSTGKVKKNVLCDNALQSLASRNVS